MKRLILVKILGTVSIFLFCAATATPADAQTLTAFSFDGTDGTNSYAGVVQGDNGNLYGTTALGGANNLGVLFAITPGGTLKTVYNFCSQGGVSCTDGAYPEANLVQATDRNVYGTAAGGGNTECPSGCGTVFKVAPNGTLTTLYTFCSQGGASCTDGAYPNALIQGTNGNFYGTTNGGGANNLGTVFEITPRGALTTLSSFDNTSGGGGYAQLIQATNGDFYGTTYLEGANGYGTVFKITPGGVLTTLHSFDNTDGSSALSLVQATNGNLYGTTFEGGANGSGTVYEITLSGKFKTLYSFTNGDDGSGPNPLVQGTDGNFYGAASGGGANGAGTVFEITPSGTLKTLYSFCSQGVTSCTDGAVPNASLIQDTNGKFYGTTIFGGSGTCQYGCGTVFSLSLGLGRFVETLLTSGKVGASVEILGTNLTGATAVTFNGAGAAFTVLSSSEITTTVPTGATTGTVEVTTPTGTLKSNVVFRVKP